jgi:formate-dependent nitrite reductase membrane component NrfD
MPQHFVAPPQWEWYIVWYFFLGGLAGGGYVLATILRLTGDQRDGRVARRGFLLVLPVLAICPILLTLDLGRPLRFWHMLIDARTLGLNFKYWSPMSVGAWALLIFGVFAVISFVDAALGPLRLLRGAFGRLFMIVGSFFGAFLAGYTGVLLSVSNQPIWSDTWALGGLFLASGLKLFRADRYFSVLEIILLIAFFVTLGAMGGRYLAARWLVLWALVAIGMLVPLVPNRSPRPRGMGLLACGLVLIGALALRIVVIFSAQT